MILQLIFALPAPLARSGQENIWGLREKERESDNVIRSQAEVSYYRNVALNLAYLFNVS